MQALSSTGQQIVGDLAQRHGFSMEAVQAMLESVISGNGSMAQFNHWEFGGAGQWMQGGMTMISDMFNNALKGRVDGLCSELSRVVANQPGLLQSGCFQSQSQGEGYQQWQGSGQQAGGNGGGLFVAQGGTGNWWPSDLGMPASSGSQNGLRYAWFPQLCRLAIDLNGRVSVHDTLDHQIGGFSQQQSGNGTVTFSSQYGLMDLSSLPLLSVDGIAPAPLPSPAAPAFSFPPQPTHGGSGEDVFVAIERLAALHGRGILSNEEFSAKKAELLGRL